MDACTLCLAGVAENAPSLDFLEKMYTRIKPIKPRDGLLGAIGVHQEPGPTVPFLARILNGNEDDRIRKQASFWLGQQDVPEALSILDRAARTDRSVEIRKQAVFTVSQFSLPKATDTLIGLSRNADTREVKKQALFWLAQRASQNLGETIRGFVYPAGHFLARSERRLACRRSPDQHRAAQVGGCPGPMVSPT